MSIRLRLTLLYSLILAVTLGVFSIVLYLTLAHSTRTFMEDTLAVEMRRMVRSNAPPIQFIQWPADSVGASETYWQACDSRGNVMGRTDNLRDHTLPLSEDGLRQVQDGRSIYEITRINDTPLLIFSQPVIARGNTTGILQVARSIAEQEQALHTLQSSLLIGSLFMVLFALGSGWFLAGTSLRPIDQLTRTARMIGTEQNFNRRVQYNGPNDEVGRLATTFNGMLSALDTAYQQVAQALQAQRSFIADASHELRTPLTTLRGNLALLEREPPISPEDRQAVMADIIDENGRMIRLVNDLMILARADYTPQVEMETVLLASLFAEVERQANNLCSSCTFWVAPVSDIQVKGKRDLLKQVLLILLDNAFKFTPSGGRVELSAEQRGEMVSIRVRDTGIGIAKDHLPRIFQRFYRTDQARNGSGYGLGLAIAKALIEKQNGHIVADSELGQGCTFTITLCTSELSVPVTQMNGLVYSYAKTL